jgi:hypothetical protein
MACLYFPVCQRIWETYFPIASPANQFEDLLVNPAKQAKLNARVVTTAERVLAQQGFVSSIDVLVGIGWLAEPTLAQWRQGRREYLERNVQANLARISTAMKLFRRWAMAKGLSPSETNYVARTPGRPTLRFSKSGDSSIERHYRTHWISPALSEKKVARMKVKLNQPDLVVIQPLNRDWKCHRCGGTGGFLIMEEPGPCCLVCANLDTLEFLPAGDAALTRRARQHSQRYAVVVRFSQARKHYERQGILIEPEALRHARSELSIAQEVSSTVPVRDPS